MITKTKNQYYIDLKVHDRLKFFRGNNLECIMEIDNILNGEMGGYIKNDRGTYRFKTIERGYKSLFNGGGVYNFGKGSGRRIHIRLELPKFCEFRRE